MNGSEAHRGPVARIWSALPDELRTLIGIAAIAGFAWSARGWFDGNLASPNRVAELERWTVTHDSAEAITDAAIDARFDAVESVNERQDGRLESLNCKYLAVMRSTDAFGC